MSIETEIQIEVDALRARFSDTKTLYREVCALLFFRYGITPTANKLYQFVRKGSMSAPVDALAKFWDELRSKARIEIDHPDLPEEIKATAASAIAALWQQASAAARDQLQVLRDEAATDLDVAKAQLADAQVAQGALQGNIEALHGQAATATAAGDLARSELESERRAHAATSARCLELQHQVDDLKTQLQRQQDGFSADLAKAREAAEAASERAASTERRVLLEVDQERQARGRADKAQESLRTQAAQTEERLRAEIQRLLEESARHQTSLATSTAAVEAATAQMQIRQARIDTLEGELDDAKRQAVQARTEADTLRTVLDRLGPPADASDGRKAKARRSDTTGKD